MNIAMAMIFLSFMLSTNCSQESGLKCVLPLTDRVNSVTRLICPENLKTTLVKKFERIDEKKIDRIEEKKEIEDLYNEKRELSTSYCELEHQYIAELYFPDRKEHENKVIVLCPTDAKRTYQGFITRFNKPITKSMTI